MPKAIKKSKNYPSPEQPFSDSHSLRKFMLLVLVVCALFFDLMIILWNGTIPRETHKMTAVQKEKSPLEKRIDRMVKGFPIEKMTPYISKKDDRIAAFVVGVAKKESNWGVHVPVLNGKDCYNYWGYRAQSDRMTWDGYTCFDNPRQAVNTVSRRFEELVNDSNLTTPQDMVVWKCGWDCSWDNKAAVQKWARDVAYYFDEIYQQ